MIDRCKSIQVVKFNFKVFEIRNEYQYSYSLNEFI